MKKELALLLGCLLMAACGEGPRGIIFDTDWWTDVDDCCALRTMLEEEKEGRIELLGVCLSAVNETSVASLSSFLGNEGRKGMPLGADKLATDHGGEPVWHEAAMAGCPQREAETVDDVEDCVEFYRRTLSQARGKVDIVTVGFPNAVARLLESGPDKYSRLSGEELVRKKVRHLWMMAGQYPEGREYNFANSARSREAGALICSRWPTEITFLGFEVGIEVVIGGGLPEEDLIHKIFTAYGCADGRYAWDPLTVWMACLGSPEAAGFDAVRGTVTLDPATGVNHFTPSADGPHRYVRMLHDSAWYAAQFRPILGEQ